MEPTTPPRPTRRDPDVIQAAANQLAPDVFKWCGDGDTTLEDITTDLVKALRWKTDGYELARELDDYSPDAELVEILDKADILIHAAQRKACEEWVKSTRIPAPAIGMQVAAITDHSGVGEVVSNYPHGQSVVNFPGLGHVKAGTGCYGTYIDWEKLQPAEQPPSPST